MIQQGSRIALLLCLASATVLLNGCFDTSRPAPVVNAWYQPGAASKFYVVRSGDTIYSIAFAFGLDYRALAAANHLNPPYSITSGQRLIMTHKPPVETHNVSPMLRLKPLEPYHHNPASVQPIAQRWSTAPTLSLQAVALAWRWPAKGRLLQQFSRSPDGHPGISIAGRLGEPVRAAAMGTVVYSGDGIRGYGNLIIIKHDDSYLSAYAFNQHNNVIVGEQVKAGSVIARMGQNDAGRTLLYFEIRRNGVPENPLRFLK